MKKSSSWKINYRQILYEKLCFCIITRVSLVCMNTFFENESWFSPFIIMDPSPLFYIFYIESINSRATLSILWIFDKILGEAWKHTNTVHSWSTDKFRAKIQNAKFSKLIRREWATYFWLVEDLFCKQTNNWDTHFSLRILFSNKNSHHYFVLLFFNNKNKSVWDL